MGTSVVFADTVSATPKTAGPAAVCKAIFDKVTFSMKEQVKKRNRPDRHSHIYETMSDAINKSLSNRLNEGKSPRKAYELVSEDARGYAESAKNIAAKAAKNLAKKEAAIGRKGAAKALTGQLCRTFLPFILLLYVFGIMAPRQSVKMRGATMLSKGRAFADEAL